MKKLLSIGLCILVCFCLFSCQELNKGEKSIASYDWTLEYISSSDGKPLFNGKSQDLADIDILDLTIKFEKNRFILNDNTNNKAWRGNYSLEKISDSYKLDMRFDDSGKKISGVFGTRFYYDGSKQETILLVTDDKIISFVGK